MGQFVSKAFDGDPYIEIMRQLPDKELCWWIQKVIWVAEGFTLAEHMARTYPQLLVYKCNHCNGAGTVTCPHCQGYKIRRATSHNGFRLSQQTDVGRLLAVAGSQECDHCGTFCPWDAESEWQGKWEDWERKLAYYDRSYGKLMDNWYEDVVNEGRLDEDTAPAEEPEPGPNDDSIMANLDRRISKMPGRVKAMMARMGGHPYENFDMLPYQILDPTKPIEENVDRMGMDYNWLPPELDPQGFPEFLVQAHNPIAQFEHQIRMEYLLFNNLEAAINDKPKPAQFGPVAGTVICPECDGKPHKWSWTPNLAKLFRAEPPFWLATLQRMDQLGTADVSAAAYRRRQALAAGPGAYGEDDDAPSTSGRRRAGEAPHGPFKDTQVQAALDRAGGLARVGPRSKDGGIDYGPTDPLGYSAPGASDGTQLVDAASRANPLTGASALDAAQMYANLNPAKNAARQIRDLRTAAEVASPEDKSALLKWFASRDRAAGNL